MSLSDLSGEPEWNINYGHSHTMSGESCRPAIYSPHHKQRLATRRDSDVGRIYSTREVVSTARELVTMKCAVVVLALCVAALAQHRPPEETQPPISVTVEELIWLEVGNIVRDDPRISQSECKARCDAHFALSDALDESLTDIVCQRECELAVAGHEDFHRPPGDRGGRD